MKKEDRRKRPKYSPDDLDLERFPRHKKKHLTNEERKKLWRDFYEDGFQ